MPQHLKAPVNGVVTIRQPNPFGVILEYRRDKNHRRYLVLPVSDRRGRRPHGQPIWLDAEDFTYTGIKARPPGRTYRKILKHLGPVEMRDCGCHCCPHYSGVLDEEGKVIR